MGCPIRKFTDQSLFAAPHDLSQRTTSFIASQHQGIHRILLRHLITLIIDTLSAIPKGSSDPAMTAKRSSHDNPEGSSVTAIAVAIVGSGMPPRLVQGVTTGPISGRHLTMPPHRDDPHGIAR